MSDRYCEWCGRAIFLWADGLWRSAQRDDPFCDVGDPDKDDDRHEPPAKDGPSVSEQDYQRCEFRRDERGDLDEVVLRDVQLVHVEMLNSDQAYLQFHYADGSWGQVAIAVENCRLYLTVDEEPIAKAD